MKPAEVQAGVRRAWSFVGRLDLQESLSSFAPLPVNEEFRDVALDPSSRYEQVYLAGLERSYYNFILTDYSYFQFSCDVRDEYRFAFLPNPFISPIAAGEVGEWKEFVAEGIMSLEEYFHKLSELRTGQHPPMLRYENSPLQYKKLLHPQSHFHVGHHGENRWPLERELTVMAFTAIVLKYFYPKSWGSNRHIDAQTSENALEAVLAAEKAECRLVPIDRFSVEERAQFFYS